MKTKFRLKNCLTAKLTAILLLSTIWSCSSVYADGDYFFDLIPTDKLLNPIYLDKTRTDTPNDSKNTIIPHKLRDFDEADYFSSSAVDESQSKPPPVMDFANMPSPSEYKKVNSLVTKKDIEQDIKPINNVFTPLEVSPKVAFDAEEQDVQKAEQPTFEVVDETYLMTSTRVYGDDIDLEGKEVSSIKFLGLKSIPASLVSKHIKTQQGSLYNSEILQEDLQNIYSIGYFSDNMSVDPILKTDNTVELVFIVEENILIKNVSITGNNVITTDELLPFVVSLKNKPQNLVEINKSIGAIQDYYHEKDYILASVFSVDDDSEGNLSFTIAEGIINKIEIAGNEKTKDYVIARNMMTLPGSVYNEECLKKDLSKVFSTQIFEEVNRDIKPSDEKEGTFDVTVVVKEKSTNSIGLGGGIDTGLGAFGSVSLKEDNFLGRAQRLSLNGIIGSGILLNDASIKNHMNYQAELSFFEPYFLNADNSLMAKLYFREMGSWNIPLAIEQRIGFKTGVEHKVKGYDNLTTSFTAGVERIHLKEGDYGKISQLYALHNLDIKDRAKQLTDGFFFNVTPGIRYSNLDDNELPREGIIAQAQFNEAIGISNFKHTTGRLNGAVTRFYPVFKKSTVSLTGKAGIKVHGDHMPEIMAYRLGGPYSIRGFRMHGVGAGESFVMGSAEFATPLPLSDRLKWDFIKKMRLTFFVDAGEVFNPTISNVLYDRPLHAITAGIGLRVNIPGIGPMSIDYGLPLINPGSYGSEHGYFTFGAGGLNMYGYGY